MILASHLDPAAGALLRRLDAMPITGRHVAILVCAGFGFMFDLAEMALGGALSAVFLAPTHAVPANRLSWLLASVFLGAIVGAPLAGRLADRVGRKRMLVVALLVLSVTSLLGGLSAGIGWLTVFRGLSGLALGAYPPLFITYLTDLLPVHRRGALTMVAVALASFGPVAVIFGIRWLEPSQPLGLEGWRWALILGGSGAFLVALFLSTLPESPRFLIWRGDLAGARAVLDGFERSARRGRRPAASAVEGTRPAAMAATPAEPPAHRTLVVLALLAFLHPWATVGFGLLSGASLVQKGFRLTDTLFYVGVAAVGPVLGTLLAAPFIDRLERRRTLAICATVMAAAGIAFGLATAPAALVLTSLTFTLLAACYLPVVSLYTAESFPTARRAWGSSSAWAANRIGSALVPLALVPLLQSSGAVAMFTVISGALMASVLLLLWFGPSSRAGRAVT